MSVDFGKFSDFNKDASFDMIRFGAGVPIPECELNEMQQIQLQHIKSINKHLYGDNHFIGCGDMTFNADTHEFVLKNQYVMLDDGTMIYIDKLEGICNDGNTVFLDFELKDIRYVDVIHKYGNKQSSDIIENNILDPRVGKQTTMRKQWCYDLFIAKQSIEVDNHIYIPVAKNNGGRLVDLRNCVEIINNRNTNDAQYSKVSTGSTITDIECRQDGFVSGEKIYGRTLQNLWNVENIKGSYSENYGTDRINIDLIRKPHQFTRGTYTLINVGNKVINISTNDGMPHDNDQDALKQVFELNAHSKLVINLEDLEYVVYLCGLFKDGWENSDKSKEELAKSLIVLKGDWTNKETPTQYFSGLKSVEDPIEIKAVGKNLFNKDTNVHSYGDNTTSVVDGNSIIVSTDSLNNIKAPRHIFSYVSFIIPVKPNTKYSISAEIENIIGNNARIAVWGLDINNNSFTGMLHWDYPYNVPNTILWTEEQWSEILAPNSKSSTSTGKLHFTTKECTHNILFVLYTDIVRRENGNVETMATKECKAKFSNIQLEEGTEITEYEPYKETVQTIYTEPLRSIGDIKDEIDIDRGVITRRVATNNENYAKGRIWGSGTTDTHLTICTYNRYNVNSPTRKEMQDMKLVCDIFPVIGTDITTDALRALMPNISSPQIFIDKDGDIDIVASKTFFTDNGYTADENGFKKYLSEHPHKFMATLPVQRPNEEKINIPPLRVFDSARHLIVIPGVEFDCPQNIKAQVDENTDELQRVGKNLIIPSNPNLLINGDFQVWQRGTSFNGNTSRPTYTVDRWIITGDTCPKVEKVENGVKITSTQNGTWTNFYTKLENITLRKLIGKTLTYTIKLKVPTRISQVWSVTVGTGSGEYQYHHSKRFNDKNYEYLTGSFVVKSTQLDDNGFFEFGIQGISEANNSFEIEYAKLEVGDKATPFVPRNYGEELALCQRYYCTEDWSSTNALRVLYKVSRDYQDRGLICFPTEMRVTPTINLVWDDDVINSSSYVNGKGIDSLTSKSFVPYVNRSSEGVNNKQFVPSVKSYTADAEIY